jgi:hypothetical protein
VIACVATVRVAVANFAIPPLSVAVPRTLPPFLNVTVPVGVPVPVCVTVAVNVTDCPNIDGFFEDATLVVVVFAIFSAIVDEVLVVK